MSTGTTVNAAALRTALPATARPSAEPRARLEVVQVTRPNHPVLWLVAVIAMLAASVLGAVSLNALAAADSVAARQLELEVAEAERLHSDLIAEVAHLDAPERIRQVATEQLGMIEANAPRYVVLGRSLPSDNTGVDAPSGDPLKPVLAAER